MQDGERASDIKEQAFAARLQNKANVQRAMHLLLSMLLAEFSGIPSSYTQDIATTLFASPASSNVCSMSFNAIAGPPAERV